MATEMTATPGPWKAVRISDDARKDPDLSIDDRDQFWIVSTSGAEEVIATVAGSMDGDAEPNALLFAAAPTMKAALTEIVERLSTCRAHSCPGFDCAICDSSRLQQIARDAIDATQVPNIPQETQS